MYECEHEKRRRNPREKASLASILTFFYVRSIFLIGLRRDLLEEDVYQVPKVCKSSDLTDLLEVEWDKEVGQKRPSLLKALARVFWKEQLFIGGSMLVYRAVFIGIQPFLVETLVAFFKKGQTTITLNQAYVYASALVVMFVVKHVCWHNVELLQHVLAIKARTAVSSLIYRKSLKLSRASITKMSSGRIVSLISKDIYVMNETIICTNEVTVGITELLVMVVLLYRAIGIPAFVGVGFIFVSYPFQFLMGNGVAKLRKKCGAKTDERLRLIQEILTTIRIIKMHTWKRFYVNRTDAERKAEIRSLRWIIYLKNFILFLGTFTVRVSFYLCVITYMYLGMEMAAEKIFFVVTCYATLQNCLSLEIPLAIGYLSETKASFSRIRKLLLEPPLDDAQNDAMTITNDKRARILLKNVVAALNPKLTIFHDLSLELVREESSSGLVALTGALGSGKSSLLKAVLGDLKIVSGTINVDGSVSYASQEPWLFPASLRQNILFGEPFSAERYAKVVELCALRSDIERLPDGDETVIIDKGLNLSRGQQARVNLARAVYKEADIYLLDDSLSSLDTNVSRSIFSNCFKEFLKGKLRVIVTHQQQYLKEADRIVYLKDGAVLVQGSYEDVMKSEYSEELRRNQIDFDNDNDNDNDNNNDKDITKDNDFKRTFYEENCASDANDAVRLLEKKKVYQEDNKMGKVDLEIYKIYFKNGKGLPYIIFTIVVFLLAVISEKYFDYFVTYWIEVEEKVANLTRVNMTNTTEYEESLHDKNMVPVFYTTIILGNLLFDVLQLVFYFYLTTTISINFHRQMFGKLMKATMEFFDLHLSGNILNRFAKDMGNIDEYLPGSFTAFAHSLVTLFGILTIISSSHYIFLLYSAIMAIMLYVMRRHYMPVGRSMNRLDNATRAPVVGHISATLDGLTTIRASKAEEILKKQFDQHQDLHSSATYMLVTATRAFSFYADVLVTIYIIAILFTFLTISQDSTSTKVGLALTQSFTLSGRIKWLIISSTSIETCMTSVERVVEYSRCKEEPKGGNEWKNWPSEGRIEFKNVSLKYSTNPEPILRDLSFEVRAGERVGIIGRTGAGKSSIISTLFRLYEVTGDIVVDNRNLRTLKLGFLRSRLSIIPQDPVLFTGTLRSNLDPSGEFEDARIWSALEAVGAREVVQQLESRIEEGGRNLSTGQRQLVCLARALLSRTRILVLDEATANVDPRTDALIQRTIRDRFSDCTVLTIAHRLDTILDSDRILVLDKGALVEFDSPKNLLNDETSRFYAMAKLAGLIKLNFNKV